MFKLTRASAYSVIIFSYSKCLLSDVNLVYEITGGYIRKQYQLEYKYHKPLFVINNGLPLHTGATVIKMKITTITNDSLFI